MLKSFFAVILTGAIATTLASCPTEAHAQIRPPGPRPGGTPPTPRPPVPGRPKPPPKPPSCPFPEPKPKPAKAFAEARN
jgi:hypothetical protein